MRRKLRIRSLLLPLQTGFASLESGLVFRMHLLCVRGGSVASFLPFGGQMPECENSHSGIAYGLGGWNDYGSMVI